MLSLGGCEKEKRGLEEEEEEETTPPTYLEGALYESLDLMAERCESGSKVPPEVRAH